MSEDMVSLLNRRIAETIAWCAWQPFVKNGCTPGDLAYICQLETDQLAGPRTANDPPVGILRTPDLEPPDLFTEATTFTGRRIAIEMLAKARAQLLRERDLYPPDGRPVLGKGRLLLYNPDACDHRGDALWSSSGYFSWQDAPPWDSWIMIFRQAAQSADAATFHLLAWVPPNLVEVAAAGIAACSTGCIQWIEEGDAAIIHYLRFAGLLA